ncbi:type II secretion system protein [Kamptonema cortianum]|nr:type II secretion system protein [Kamptonema cortianum]
MTRRAAFTLTELLVVIGIIATIAALIFPVFASAKNQARHVAWMDSFHQVSLGTTIYMGDYDDRYMIPKFNYDEPVDPVHDRTWVQGLLPYVRAFELFVCPVDNTRDPSLTAFDPDLVGADTYARYYRASTRSNIGFNYAYLSPAYRNGQWVNDPRSSSSVNDPSNTLQFGDSVWEMKNGRPHGGGNFLVLPPCRFALNDGQIVDSFGISGGKSTNIFQGNLGWVEKSPDIFAQAGGLYAWFKTSITVSFTDGHTARLRMNQITAGCDVRENWAGYILNESQYIWDLR